ncbi:hypothetical protein MF672_019490 [Actinomadura sp. ATCC 31491]|uniref:DUF8094 domain-containing protein n=1 Tax=Actinomadura luzonensis TaxID=2805427 RepID=A0ABT0FUH0_9ACTN|nr:hypothetical protein [Actinomadura luzonensis]MCK2215962.1 hypothetical protein [Actinomadura luzonensis]
MRRTLLIAAFAVTLSGCAAVPGRIPWPAAPPSPTATPTSTPVASTPTPTPAPSSPARAALTAPEARKALLTWLDDYNATLKRRKWWRQNSRLDALFIEAALHEGVLERNHETFGWKPGHKPIHPTGTPAVYLPRPERQPPIGDWFIAKATYKDVKGHARPHLLAFFRAPGGPFKLAVATPLHWGQRAPEPLLDAAGHVTDMNATMAAAVAEEYRNFWNNEKKEGASGYRLARDSYSRKAFPAVNKGMYVRFAGHGSVFGFRTADGGSFFLFALVNSTKSVNQVLSEALLVPKGSRTIRELGANWFS